MSEYLCVYGTLMRAYEHDMAHLLAAQADYLGEAFFTARLYLVAHYPGAVASEQPADKVHGELYRLRGDPTALLRTLDDYEAGGPDVEQPAEFVRRVARVTGVSGETVDAWVYFYTRPVSGLPRIATGRFLQHIATQEQAE